ncbi:hypothetical protein L6452_36437 [Arctium lappa]|uniref:Uncharacterized protein n=1 Tax=Arctium lappa TaxID=4217 RepID=A0ACB8Y8K8_ARCLA|nr:hypothetical protein L6452_36437 [Arctium lappa]
MFNFTVPDLFDHFPLFSYLRGGCMFLMRLTPSLTMVVVAAALVEELFVDSDILGAMAAIGREIIEDSFILCATSAAEDLVFINLLHSMEVLNAMKFLNLL